MMQLQRDSRTGADRDALDLVVRTRINTLVVTPWPVDTCMQVNFLALLRSQLFDNILDLLHVVAVGDQQRIVSVDNDHVIDTQGNDKAVIGPDIAVCCHTAFDITNEGIALAVDISDIV